MMKFMFYYYTHSFNLKLVHKGAVVVQGKPEVLQELSRELSLGQQGNHSKAQQSHLSLHFSLFRLCAELKVPGREEGTERLLYTSEAPHPPPSQDFQS